MAILQNLQANGEAVGFVGEARMFHRLLVTIQSAFAGEDWSPAPFEDFHPVLGEWLAECEEARLAELKSYEKPMDMEDTPEVRSWLLQTIETPNPSE